MRESTRYLMALPGKYFGQLVLLTLALLGMFRLVESRAPAYGPIHDTLWLYAFLMAFIATFAGLECMLETYVDMRLGETRLMRYLADRDGIGIS